MSGSIIIILQVHIHLLKSLGSLEETEPTEYERVPKLVLHLNGKTYSYGETFVKEIILHFINRHIYPIVLLKTEEAIDRFVNTDLEWKEDTPFYSREYLGYGQYFPMFRKVTRVIAFINHKNDFKDEINQLNEAAMTLADRDDLRIAKVTNPKLVKKYKEKYANEWFPKFSSNALIMFKKESIIKDQIIHNYDLLTQTENFVTWISEKSLEPLEELSGITFRIVPLLKKPMFLAFINRTHPEYGAESVQLHNTLRELAKDFPQFIFTYTEEDRFRANKESKYIQF